MESTTTQDGVALASNRSASAVSLSFTSGNGRLRSFAHFANACGLSVPFALTTKNATPFAPYSLPSVARREPYLLAIGHCVEVKMKTVAFCFARLLSP